MSHDHAQPTGTPDGRVPQWLPRTLLVSLLGLVAIAGLGVLRAAPEGPGTSRVGGQRPRLLTVRDFGAVGDGQTDDAAAIQRAIDEGDGDVVFPAGDYKLTRSIVARLNTTGRLGISGTGTARLMMFAPGPALQVIGTHGGTADPKSVMADVWEKERMPRISGIEIVGAHAEADGIEARGTMQISIDGVLLRKLRHGVRLVERNRNVLISDCHIYENSGCGVLLDQVNLHQTNITGSHISYCGGGGVVTRGGEVRNLHIVGCDIEACQSPEGPPTANVLIDCSTGSTAEVTIVGCTIQHGRNAPESANVRILGQGKFKMKGEMVDVQCGHVTIADNVFSDVQTNVHLSGVRGATITGNTMWQGWSHNLVLENCQQVVLTGNMLERNPMYGYTDEASNRVRISACQDLTIESLHLQSAGDNTTEVAALLIEKCERLQLRGLTLLDCQPTSLEIRDSSHVTLCDATLRYDRPGLSHTLLKWTGGDSGLILSTIVSGEVEIAESSLARPADLIKMPAHSPAKTQ
ncbi:Parallel beta-helix repeat protein [Pirellula staleyi DSM 6068]|uniref:Parallel beta-helix repeat protein n=1 Tax=Pirellula staleyi (strain ATCC 27377 / DSM 6068 / ICPB 4128) TaxID=530564 RepID=D2R3M3_PIRSD|nr:right-handed parallel beta-helix repeat-containing protein [Pirellula staleyi]ADB16977.1 Parallel beta-helix repeat protein [Pirellula staleyi DSM 6068]